ncbi:hypothetical protein [Enterococcus sp. LJL90]
MLKKELAETIPTIDTSLIEIIKISDSLKNEIRDFLDISQIDIPTIVFTGSDTELATVFENLNRGGKKLSKYQVFAAQWYKYNVLLSGEYYNLELLERTINWYEILENERGIEIENFNPDLMRENSEINIAELCFSFGKIIIEETPVFWNNSTDDTANEIGYSTMAIILGVKNKDLSSIIDKKNREFFKDANLIEGVIKSAITIYKDLNKYFKKYLHNPGDIDSFRYSLGTNFQILSYFASLWNTRYDLNLTSLTLQTKHSSAKDYDRIKKHLLKWYVYDTVEGNWSGSGDSKLDQIAIEFNNKYLNDISSENLNNSLMKWYDEQLQKKSINFEPVAKMLYTINASFDSNLYNSAEYDLEHVIPRKLISKASSQALISGGTLGNLMFLEKNVNRGKKEQFMYDYVNDDISDIKEEFIDLNFYPQKKSLIDVKIEIEKNTNDFSNTQAIIKNRGNSIINALVKNLG